MGKQVTSKNVHTEQFAEEHAEQWLGCVTCGHSHHETSFCSKCGRCYYEALAKKNVDNSEVGTFVYCECGQTDMWD